MAGNRRGRCDGGRSGRHRGRWRSLGSGGGGERGQERDSRAGASGEHGVLLQERWTTAGGPWPALGVVRLRQAVAARTSAPPAIAIAVGVSPCISQTNVGL